MTIKSLVHGFLKTNGSTETLPRPTSEKRGLCESLKCNSYIAFAVHGSRASPRTAYALTVHPELVEGFFELRCESTVTVQ